MATLSIDTDNKIIYDKDDPISKQLAKEYQKFQAGHAIAPNWNRLTGGRSGFMGSGFSLFRVVIADVAYIVTIDRYANGKSFYGTDHGISYKRED